MSDRKLFNERISIESYEKLLHNMTPGDIIDAMKEIRIKYGDRHVFFEVVPYGHDGASDLWLVETRQENDVEYTLRKAAAEKVAKKKRMAEEKEYAEYVRLKAKFGDKDE